MGCTNLPLLKKIPHSMGNPLRNVKPDLPKHKNENKKHKKTKTQNTKTQNTKTTKKTPKPPKQKPKLLLRNSPL